MNGPIIDVNVNLSRWPTRRFRDDETATLVAKLQSMEVVEAWAGSFDGLLHKDIAGVNARLAEECSLNTAIRLRPFGSINPQLPDWEEDLRRCAEVHHMPGIRVHPNYHGYKLDDPSFARLLKIAAERGLIVSLIVQMEDERMMHPLLRVRPVDLQPLAELVKTTVNLRLVVLNVGRLLRNEPLTQLLGAGEVYIDIAMHDGLGVIGEVLKQVPLERMLFGSHTPFHYFEAGIFKMQESSLAAFQLRAIQSENARRLLPET